MEGLYRKKGGARELLGKEKKALFFVWDIFSLGEEQGRGFYYVDCLFFPLGIERACVTDYLTGA